ncbi:MAG: hypothetical protein AAF081_09895 [Actinomycetota bacterium]
MTTPLIAEFDSLSARHADEFARAGVWWTGEEKLAIVAVARAAMAGLDAPDTTLSVTAVEAARKVAADAASIRRADVERWAADGVRVEAYVELVGVIGRLAAIDTAAFGLGLDPTPMPAAVAGAPLEATVPDIDVVDGWVPTDGPAFPPTAYTAVPGATELWIDVSDVLYMPMREMGDPAYVRDDLTRAQIELVAARTSYLNDCFY